MIDQETLAKFLDTFATWYPVLSFWTHWAFHICIIFWSCRYWPSFWAEVDLSLKSPMCLLLSPALMPSWHSTWIIRKIQASVLMVRGWKLPNKKWYLVNVSYCQAGALQTYSTLPLAYILPLVSTTAFQISSN